MVATTGNIMWTARPRSVARRGRCAEGAPSTKLSTIRRFFLSLPLRRTNGVPLVPSSRYGRRSLPLPGTDLLLLFPGRIWKQATTDDRGGAAVDLHTTRLPMTVFASAPGHAARLAQDWIPGERALAIDLKAMPTGGSVIFPQASGHLPGLKGRLNPVRDARDRTFLYASNIAINAGRHQPVHFIPGEELQPTDAEGANCAYGPSRYLDGRSHVIPEYSLGECPPGVDCQPGMTA